jgi:hypothetical protein
MQKSVGNSSGENLSEAEEFANAYLYFIQALKVLASDVDTQCSTMSDYNVAWQLKDDVSRSAALLELPGARELTQEGKDGISAMVAALKELPASLLVAAPTAAANRKAMNHPAWGPLRTRASTLLRLLAPMTARVEAFLGLG